MATKVSIIDVDLDIGEIISQEISAITGSTKEILEEIRQNQLQVAKAKQAIADKEDAAKAKLLAAVQQLIAAGPKGIPVSEIYTAVTPEINTITVTARIKNHLKNNGNEWALVKQRINKADRYILIPYNHED